MEKLSKSSEKIILHRVNNMNKEAIKKTIRLSAKNTFAGLKQNIPIILGILLLISIIKWVWLTEKIAFLDNRFLHVILGDILGSISAWNPINSYILVSDMFEPKNIIVITTFLIAWTTVGILQFPWESYFFGKRFSFIRNVASFLFAVIWGYIISYLTLWIS